MIKYYEAIIHTGGKTEDQLKAMFDDGPYTLKDLENLTEYYRQLDGMGAIICQSEYDQGTYVLCAPIDNADMARFKEVTYLMEQDSLIGSYINGREAFDRDWDADEYFPNSTMILQLNEAEVLKEWIGGKDNEPSA